MNRFLCALLALLVLLAANLCRADVFGSGANSFEIEFVTIGQPGNLADSEPNPAGAVPYSYRIGKYEVSEQMIDKADALGGLGITKDTRGPNKPATSVTWYEAAHFVNWLNTSHTSAYKFDVAGSFRTDYQVIWVTNRKTSAATDCPATFCRDSTNGTMRRTMISWLATESHSQKRSGNAE